MCMPPASLLLLLVTAHIWQLLLRTLLTWKCSAPRALFPPGQRHQLCQHCCCCLSLFMEMALLRLIYTPFMYENIYVCFKRCKHHSPHFSMIPLLPIVPIGGTRGRSQKFHTTTNEATVEGVIILYL